MSMLERINSSYVHKVKFTISTLFSERIDMALLRVTTCVTSVARTDLILIFNIWTIWIELCLCHQTPLKTRAQSTRNTLVAWVHFQPFPIRSFSEKSVIPPHLKKYAKKLQKIGCFKNWKLKYSPQQHRMPNFPAMATLICSSISHR